MQRNVWVYSESKISRAMVYKNDVVASTASWFYSNPSGKTSGRRTNTVEKQESGPVLHKFQEDLAPKCMYDKSDLMESSASLEHYSTTLKKNKNIGVHQFFYFVAFLQNHEGDQTPEMSRLIRSSDVASVNNVYMVRVTVQLFSLKI